MRVAAAISFSLIIGCPLGLSGLLAGMYLWGHFGPPATDPDGMEAYLFGLLVGGFTGITGGVASLWRFLPRATLKASQPAKVKLSLTACPGGRATRDCCYSSALLFV